MAVVVSAPTPGNTYFRVQTTFPMDHEHDLTSAALHVGYYFLNQSAHNPFLQAGITTRIIPDLIQLLGQACKFCWRWHRMLLLRCSCLNAVLYLSHALQGLIPASFQFPGD